MVGIIAFVLGYVLVGFTCYVTMADVEKWLPVHYHLWIIIVASYTIFFVTLLFCKFVKRSVQNSIATWLFDWPARLLLVLILLASALSAFHVEDIRVCYIIDGAAVFIYLLSLLVSIRTQKHIENVQKVVGQQRVLIDEVRKASLSLCVVAKSLPPEYTGVLQHIEGIKEELRYLSPSANPDASRIEESILKQLQDLKNECLAGQAIIPQRLSLIEACIAERKNIY